MVISGIAFTVNNCDAGVALHPPVIVKVIVLVPAVKAVTRPVEASTVATLVLLLLHDPLPPLNTTVFAV